MLGTMGYSARASSAAQNDLLSKLFAPARWAERAVAQAHQSRGVDPVEELVPLSSDERTVALMLRDNLDENGGN
jgi:hypothetical protein